MVLPPASQKRMGYQYRFHFKGPSTIGLGFFSQLLELILQGFPRGFNLQGFFLKLTGNWCRALFFARFIRGHWPERFFFAICKAFPCNGKVFSCNLVRASARKEGGLSGEGGEVKVGG